MCRCVDVSMCWWHLYRSMCQYNQNNQNKQNSQNKQNNPTHRFLWKLCRLPLAFAGVKVKVSTKWLLIDDHSGHNPGCTSGLTWSDATRAPSLSFIASPSAVLAPAWSITDWSGPNLASIVERRSDRSRVLPDDTNDPYQQAAITLPS